MSCRQHQRLHWWLHVMGSHRNTDPVKELPQHNESKGPANTATCILMSMISLKMTWK